MPESKRLSPKSTPKSVPSTRSKRSLPALAAAIVVGGATAALMYLPGVTVDPVGPVDPSNPYPIGFTIASANLIPLNDVNVYLVICYAVAVPAPSAPTCQPPYKTRKFKAGWRGHALAADRPFTVVLDDFLRLAPPAKFGGADISIIVEYQPWLVPLRQEKEFRFATELGTDSRLYWASRPVGE
jgi:hypothetical protein